MVSWMASHVPVAEYSRIVSSRWTELIPPSAIRFAPTAPRGGTPPDTAASFSAPDPILSPAYDLKRPSVVETGEVH